jgi:hypothetical protein
MKNPEHFHCKRPSGNFRAWFRSREEAEKFALDPANHPVYLGDLAHFCPICRYWHLSKLEWLASDLVN